MSEREKNNNENINLEELLSPPKYDLLGVSMSLLAAIITAVVSGVVILLFSYFSMGKFSLESGISPILLAMITFFGLTLGNLLYSFLLSKIFPSIYTRGKTGLGQVVVMSIILYILFAPVYIFVSTFSTSSSIVLLAFCLHVLLNSFSLQLILGLVAHYRYALLVLYSSIASLLLSGMVVGYVFMSFSQSSTALFLLLGLVIVSQTLSTAVYSLVAYIYSHIYTTTGLDPIGSLFARIESEEKALEFQASTILTRFPQK